MAWNIVRYAKSFDRSQFNCGVPNLDVFLFHFVNQYEKRNLGRTYVLVLEGEKRVYGYYTLAGGHIPRECMPTEAMKKLSKHPVPVVLLARLAVDQSMKGRGLGRELLANALVRSVETAEHIGFHAMLVETIDDQAIAFYRKHGFTPLVNQPNRLILPLSAIGKGD
jgi:GNAT superfamily N-acetyltransferase